MTSRLLAIGQWRPIALQAPPFRPPSRCQAPFGDPDELPAVREHDSKAMLDQSSPADSELASQPIRTIQEVPLDADRDRLRSAPTSRAPRALSRSVPAFTSLFR